jgi:hypothetical protein
VSSVGVRVAGAVSAAVLLCGCAGGAPETALPTAGSDRADAPGGPGPTARPGVSPDAPTTGSDTAEAAAGSRITHPEIRDVGDELTAALGSGDVEAWMALTDLDVSGDRQQRDWFAGVQAVPMELREMHPTELLEAGEAGGSATVRFAFRHQIIGAAPDPALELYDLTLNRSQVGWRITGVTGADTEDTAYPRLWDLGPVTVTEGEHSVVVSGVDADPAQAAVIDAAAGAALDILPVKGIERLEVQHAGTDALGDLVGEPGEGATWSWSYSVPLRSPVVDLRKPLPDVSDDSWGMPYLIVAAHSVTPEVAALPDMAGGSPTARVAAATALIWQRTFHYSPAWVEAGFPGWFASSGDDRTDRASRGTYPVDLGAADAGLEFPPSGEEFYADEAPIERYYAESASIFAFVDSEFGRTVAHDLAADLVGVNPDSIHRDEQLDAIFTEHLAVDRAGAEQLWSAWIRAQLMD